MAGIGHNGGPSLEPGFGFRKLAWTKARKDLLPTLPVEIVRIRVKRAQRLGLPYRTYASIRARSGRDVVAFLFSGNSVSLGPGHLRCPEVVATRLAGLKGAAGRVAVVYGPLAPDSIQAANPGLFDAVGTAPGFTEPWAAMRRRVTGVLNASDLSADGVVLVAATRVEEDWAGAARLAGIISADAFFAYG